MAVEEKMGCISNLSGFPDSTGVWNLIHEVTVMAIKNNRRRLKIVSDGTQSGTHLVDAVSGESIGLVQSIEWHLDTSMAFAEATVKFAKVPVEVEGLNTEPNVAIGIDDRYEAPRGNTGIGGKMLAKVPVEVEGLAGVEEVGVTPAEPDDWDDWGNLDGQ
jgi:hypothetical protein